MRITAGRYKGRVLRCPSGSDIRPVMAKMRESIFSMLYSRYGGLEGLRFLDLFCGSAIMAVEAASRGAASIEAVERDCRKKNILRQNLGILDIPWKLHIADAYDYIHRLSAAAPPFDIIYLDPPFDMKNKNLLLQSLRPNLLQAQGLAIMHLPKPEAQFLPEELENGLLLERCKYYGGSALALYSIMQAN